MLRVLLDGNQFSYCDTPDQLAKLAKVGNIDPSRLSIHGEDVATLDGNLIREAEADIDALCDQVYTASASRTARYEQKYSEALRYRTLGYPGTVAETDYPYLCAEAPVRKLTKKALADLIIENAVKFNSFGAKVEAARVQLKLTVTGVVDNTAKQEAIRNHMKGLQTIVF